MPLQALVLVLAAALIHAGWNLLLKRVGSQGPLVWVSLALSCLLYAPIVWLLDRHRLGNLSGFAYLGLLVSGVLQAAYFIALNHTYRHADYSLAYPMIRGSAPLLAFAGAMLWLGERPGPMQILGALLLVAGLFWLTGGLKALTALDRKVIPLALFTAAMTGLAGVWDKYVLSVTTLSPLALNIGGMWVMVLLLAPSIRRSGDWRPLLRHHAGAILLLAMLMPLSYWLILSALTLAPVTLVAPMREISVLFAVALGSRLMGEGVTRSRFAAALLMVLGLLAIAA